MTKRILPARHETELYVNEEGQICLRQQDELGNAPHIVALEPSDVPRVIKWLQELVAAPAQIRAEDADLTDSSSALRRSH